MGGLLAECPLPVLKNMTCPLVEVAVEVPAVLEALVAVGEAALVLAVAGEGLF